MKQGESLIKGRHQGEVRAFLTTKEDVCVGLGETPEEVNNWSQATCTSNA